MIGLLISGATAFLVAIFATPFAIRVLRRNDIGQFIQEDVEGHAHKKGTPTMGGVVILLAVTVAYVISHIRLWDVGHGPTFEMREFTPQGIMAMVAFLGMGLIGFLDDFVKYARRQNQGLSKRWKFLGQIAIAVTFAVIAISSNVSTEISFTRSLGLDLGPWLYAGLVLLMLTATANAVNLTDGLDGLVAGTSALVFGAFMIIAFWQFRNPDFYQVDGALDLGLFAAALAGTVLGFMWWNAAPAQVFMGDVGSQALGGAMASLALLTNTQLLLVILGGLYVATTLSVIIQVFSFRVFGKRVFLIAPMHHHFEMKGWPETTVMIRFWILGALFVAVGLGVFYGDFITATGGP
ncbi:MAG: phospho-N-acetylmuramoyl-pentapeptide-transferase [Acidimicrobiia bacterium]|nr:phospho-N-acetylmuramoyl-pentapeptide-transferase [Acidimicrobiia bacterium]